MMFCVSVADHTLVFFDIWLHRCRFHVALVTMSTFLSEKVKTIFGCFCWKSLEDMPSQAFGRALRGACTCWISLHEARNCTRIVFPAP